MQTQCKTHGRDLAACLTRLRTEKGPFAYFIGLKGLRMLCDVLPPERCIRMRSWICEAFRISSSELQIGNLEATVFVAAIGDAQIRIGFAREKIWLAVCDIHAVSGYSAAQVGFYLNQLFERHGEDFDQYTTTIQHGSRMPPKFINVEGLRILCGLVKPASRTTALRAWLAEYGGWTGGIDELVKSTKGSQRQIARELNMPSPRSRIGTTRRRTSKGGEPKVSAEKQLSLPGVSSKKSTSERPARKSPLTPRAYCRQLCSVMMRHMTDVEVNALLGRMEAFKAEVLASRYEPRLNEAAYSLAADFQFGRARTQAKTDEGRA
eukprot:TRINITY_DN1165_c1_g2_i2.p1 TRINITY_DN1165_c1_g2~~TRINITY_DN1165_c1_g2_i2.p1  ORF type:complete len:321 (+),score=29.67 TRINITY_DN1165_c1_g2_i2:71-1033(+)